jgi:hypothetical protein
VSGFAFNIDAEAELFSFLHVYACFFEFVWAEAFTDTLFAVLFGDEDF